jgi:leucyl aminopeptidase (aminopeptidase T)
MAIIMVNLLVALLLIAGLVLVPATAMAQADDAKLAVQLAHTSASVKPGDVVVVFGGKHTLPLMEMVAIEVQKAGGQVNMMLQSDRVARSYWTEVKDQYLKQVPEYWGPWLGEVDVWIGLPGIENPPQVFGDIPQERFALGAASNQMFNDMLNSTPLRGVFISYPSEVDAKQNGLPYETYAKMQWGAINADYAAISRASKALAAKLRGAKKVRISSPAGTDVVFSMGDRPVFIDDGIVTPEESKSKLFLERWTTLPGGQVFAAVNETSAKGKVVVQKTRCQFKPMTGVEFTVQDGDIQNFKADANGSCYEEAIAPYEGPATRLGSFSIGLNPQLKVMENGGADYRPINAAGMVWLNFGDNQLLSGANKTTGGFGFPVTNATVTVDGAVVVRDGALVGD